MRVGKASEVAELCRCSVDKVYEMAQTGDLPQLHWPGPELRFDLDEIEAWLRGEVETEGATR